MFELDSVEEARAYVADFPMTKAGYLEWSFVALMAPVMLESQFDEAALARATLAPDRPAALSRKADHAARLRSRHPADARGRLRPRPSNGPAGHDMQVGVLASSRPRRR